MNTKAGDIVERLQNVDPYGEAFWILEVTYDAADEIERLTTLNTALYEALGECAEDLAMEIEDRYPPKLRVMYTSEQSRYDRDMAPVIKARALLKARGE